MWFWRNSRRKRHECKTFTLRRLLNKEGIWKYVVLFLRNFKLNVSVKGFSAFCIWERAASSQIKQNHEALSHPLRQFVKFKAFFIRILRKFCSFSKFSTKKLRITLLSVSLAQRKKLTSRKEFSSKRRKNGGINTHLITCVSGNVNYFYS